VSKLPVLKVVIAGDENVGKTSLVRRYCEGKFDASRVATIGVDFQTQVVQLPEQSVKLSIWDMAGQEHFRAVRTGFYRGSLAAALVYDVTYPESLVHLERWREEITEILPDQQFVVAGNKIDLVQTRGYKKGVNFSDSISAHYLETSALSGEGVADLFTAMAQIAYTRSLRS
jgi:small GTP-binding protein